MDKLTELMKTIVEELNAWKSTIEKKLAVYQEETDAWKKKIEAALTQSEKPTGTTGTGLTFDGPHKSLDPKNGEEILETHIRELEITKRVLPAHGTGVFLHRFWGRIKVNHSIMVAGGGDHVHGLIVRNEPNTTDWPGFNGITHASIFLNRTGKDNVKRYFRLEYICTDKVIDVVHPPLNSSDRRLIQYIQIDLYCTDDGKNVVLEHEQVKGHDGCIALLREWVK